MGAAKRQRNKAEQTTETQEKSTFPSPQSSSKRSKLSHSSNDETIKKEQRQPKKKDSEKNEDVEQEQGRSKSKKKRSQSPLPKGEEEELLEQELFGTTAPSINLPGHSGSENESDEDDDNDDNEMGALLDNQLFVVDSVPTQPTDLTSVGKEKISSSNGGSNNARRRQAAWFDPGDAMISVSLADAPRLRKLRTNASEDEVGGVEYETRLRKQYEKMNPTPEWIKKSRKKISKKTDSADPSLDDAIDDALRTVSVDDRKKTSSADTSALPQTTIDIERLRDANYAAPPPPNTNIQSIGFHPTLDLLMSANEDRRLRLYNIDGEKNNFVQSIHVPELPITNAAFSPDGNSILITGPRAFFYAYDLQAGHVFKSPRGLINSGLGNAEGLGTFAFDPSSRAVAVTGKKGHVHLLDWARGTVNAGTGQVVGDLKANSPVKSLSWLPSSSSPTQSLDSSSKLMTLCEDGEAYIWDVGMRKCIGRWNDHGAISSTCLTIDPLSKYVATGSTSGVVNVYDRQTVFSNSSSRSVVQDPTPLKAIMNLTTAVTSVKFHPDSQLLAASSRIKKDSLKLIHLPSMTVFSNWPKNTTPLGHVRDIAFSNSREQRYMAIGNDKGRILLYSLNHYARRHGSVIEL